MPCHQQGGGDLLGLLTVTCSGHMAVWWWRPGHRHSLSTVGCGACPVPNCLFALAWCYLLQGAVEARNANYATICRQLTFSRRAWFADEEAAQQQLGSAAKPKAASSLYALTVDDAAGGWVVGSMGFCWWDWRRLAARPVFSSICTGFYRYCVTPHPA